MGVFDEGYPYKIIARYGVSTDIPTLERGEIGWDIDTLTFRVGDDTSQPTKIPTTKSIGAYTFANADFVFKNVDVTAGGKIGGCKISTMNLSNGFVVRKANGEFQNVEFMSGDGTINIVNPTGVNGNVDIRLSPALAALLNGGGFLTSITHDGTLSGLGTSGSPLAVIQSTESQKGAIRIATLVEASAGIVDDAALTPETLANLDANGATAIYLASIIQNNISVISSSSFSGNGRSSSPLDINAATTSLKGGIMLASQTHVNEGTDANRAVTPATLKNLVQGSATALALATALGVVSGGVVHDSTLDGNGIIGSPLSVVQATTGQRGAMQIASAGEHEGGTVDNKAMTPYGLRNIGENSTLAANLRERIGVIIDTDANVAGLENRGTNASRLKIKIATETAVGGGRFSTVAELGFGSLNNTLISPYTLKSLQAGSATAIALAATLSPNLVNVANASLNTMAATTFKANANGTPSSPQDITPVQVLDMLTANVTA